MSSLVKNENKTKASKNGLVAARIQLNSNYEKLINDNKNVNEHIKKLEDLNQKAFDNKLIFIKENAINRASYNTKKKTIDLKRDILSATANSNKKKDNENFNKTQLKMQEIVNKNPEIYGNILNLNKCENQLLSNNLIKNNSNFFFKFSKINFKNKIRIEICWANGARIQ
jgi:hypothetical protein